MKLVDLHESAPSVEAEVTDHVMSTIRAAKERYGFQASEDEILRLVKMDFEDFPENLPRMTIHDVVEILDASGVS